jgi:formylglycine-generating enzyme
MQRLFSFFICLGVFACNHAKENKRVAIFCYTPSQSGLPFIDTTLQKITARKDTSSKDMLWIDSGTFTMGATYKDGYPEEYPAHTVQVTGFWMDATEVTNEQFAAFVKATKYVTTAERTPNWELLKLQLPPNTPKPADSLLVAGGLVFTPTTKAVPLNDANNWWHYVAGANWQHPYGPISNIIGKEKHPVVQVSWEDAMAYCKWSGKRLPTEAEWEWAAQQKKGSKYSWGNEELTSSFFPANIWQGNFPYLNTLNDKYFATAPVSSFAANENGLYDMSGNVWEWCADWMDATYYKNTTAIAINPCGPQNTSTTTHPYQKIVKGGSFLCNASYCTGYRVARRSGSGWDSGSNHIGFRCVKN